MEVFRLQNKKFPIELSGKGASITGARWNSKGTEVIYTAENRALAMAEVAVHLTLATMPKGFCMITITIPDEVEVFIFDTTKLPNDWNFFPENTMTQKIGDSILRQNEFAVIKVPSAVVKGEFNYIINPHHNDFAKIKIINQEDFPFDKRIFK